LPNFWLDAHSHGAIVPCFPQEITPEEMAQRNRSALVWQGHGRSHDRPCVVNPMINLEMDGWIFFIYIYIIFIRSSKSTCHIT
jgi:hypothetical protein